MRFYRIYPNVREYNESEFCCREYSKKWDYFKELIQLKLFNLKQLLPNNMVYYSVFLGEWLLQEIRMAGTCLKEIRLLHSEEN